MGTSYAAHCVCTAVLFMVSMQDEQHSQGAFEHWIRLILQLRRLEHHVEKVAFVAKVVVRIGVLHANAVTKGKSRDCGHLGD